MKCLSRLNAIWKCKSLLFVSLSELVLNFFSACYLVERLNLNESNWKTLASLNNSLASLSRSFLNDGNIFDSTVAISFCLALTQSSSTGLLGGFLATVYIKEQRTSFVIDAQVVSPKNFNQADVKVSEVSSGPLSVAVPGFLKGLWEIHQKHGLLPWRSLIEPTIKVCREGVVSSFHLHNSMIINERVLREDKYLREVFYQEDTKRLKGPGSKIFFKKLCWFLELVADHSDGDIFEGKVGDVLAEDFEDAGTVITRDDLIKYKVKWSETVKFPVKASEIHLPNTGAILVPAALNVLNQFEFNDRSFKGKDTINDILAYHRIAETLKHIFSARARLGDPDFIDLEEVVHELLSTEFAEKIARKIDDTGTFSDLRVYECNETFPAEHGTSHFSIIAANGDAISLTSSINY